jgi:sec-independent protein translocase protein TatA
LPGTARPDLRDVKRRRATFLTVALAATVTGGETRCMGLENPLHIAVLLVVLLLVFGARRLPEFGRSLGSGMREFKDGITGASTTATKSAGQDGTGHPRLPTDAVGR